VEFYARQELLTLAEKGTLRQSATLRAQVRTHAERPEGGGVSTANFAGPVASAFATSTPRPPDPALYPEYDENVLKVAMVKEALAVLR